MTQQEIPLLGGNTSTVVRVGDTVRRNVGPWTPSVHALLRHLEAVGFAGAPRVLGIDDQGREVLTLLAGEVARRPWPPVVRQRRGIVALARLLRAYHDAVSGFVPPPDAEWHVPGVRWQLGQRLSRSLFMISFLSCGGIFI